MSIVTKQGDKRQTRLLSGEQVSKSHPRIAASGELDELLSFLGVARASVACGAQCIPIVEELAELQRELLRLGAELSCTDPTTCSWVQPVSSAEISRIETRIAQLESQVRLPREFVLPGGSVPSAHLDVARAAARRLERTAVALAEQGHFSNDRALIYLNRISDYLFLLARAAEAASAASR
jgi:cob(I)alamin adenosyltransferase